jgi:hypothetical protein
MYTDFSQLSQALLENSWTTQAGAQTHPPELANPKTTRQPRFSFSSGRQTRAMDTLRKRETSILGENPDTGDLDPKSSLD